MDDSFKKLNGPTADSIQSDYIAKEKRAAEELLNLQLGNAKKLADLRSKLLEKLLDEAREEGKLVEDYLAEYGLQKRLDSLASELEAERKARSGQLDALHALSKANSEALAATEEQVAKRKAEKQAKEAAAQKAALEARHKTELANIQALNKARQSLTAPNLTASVDVESDNLQADVVANVEYDATSLENIQTEVVVDPTISDISLPEADLEVKPVIPDIVLPETELDVKANVVQGPELPTDVEIVAKVVPEIPSLEPTTVDATVQAQLAELPQVPELESTLKVTPEVPEVEDLTANLKLAATVEPLPDFTGEIQLTPEIQSIQPVEDVEIKATLTPDIEPLLELSTEAEVRPVVEPLPELETNLKLVPSIEPLPELEANLKLASSIEPVEDQVANLKLSTSIDDIPDQEGKLLLTPDLTAPVEIEPQTVEVTLSARPETLELAPQETDITLIPKVEPIGELSTDLQVTPVVEELSELSTDLHLKPVLESELPEQAAEIRFTPLVEPVADQDIAGKLIVDKTELESLEASVEANLSIEPVVPPESIDLSAVELQVEPIIEPITPLEADLKLVNSVDPVEDQVANLKLSTEIESIPDSEGKLLLTPELVTPIEVDPQIVDVTLNSDVEALNIGVQEADLKLVPQVEPIPEIHTEVGVTPVVEDVAPLTTDLHLRPVLDTELPEIKTSNAETENALIEARLAGLDRVQAAELDLLSFRQEVESDLINQRISSLDLLQDKVANLAAAGGQVEISAAPGPKAPGPEEVPEANPEANPAIDEIKNQLASLVSTFDQFNPASLAKLFGEFALTVAEKLDLELDDDFKDLIDTADATTSESKSSSSKTSGLKDLQDLEKIKDRIAHKQTEIAEFEKYAADQAYIKDLALYELQEDALDNSIKAAKKEIEAKKTQIKFEENFTKVRLQGLSAKYDENDTLAGQEGGPKLKELAQDPKALSETLTSTLKSLKQQITASGGDTTQLEGKLNTLDQEKQTQINTEIAAAKDSGAEYDEAEIKKRIKAEFEIKKAQEIKLAAINQNLATAGLDELLTLKLAQDGVVQKAKDDLDKKARKEAEKEDAKGFKAWSKKFLELNKNKGKLGAIAGTVGGLASLKGDMESKKAELLASGKTEEEANKALQEDAQAKLDGALNAVGDFINQLQGIGKSSTQHQAAVDTRLQGLTTDESQGGVKKSLGSYWRALSWDIGSGLGASPFFLQQEAETKFANLISQGIAFNVKERAFLDVLKDKIATTFNVADGTLLKLVRIQQADTSAARLGMESALTEFLNSMYATTEYMQQAAESIRSNLYEATALMEAKDATVLEYQVQKWMGSLYSVGFSNTEAISAALGKLAAGDVSGITEGGVGNLLVMAANESGKAVADILEKGLTGDEADELLKSMVDYLAKLYNETKGSNVLAQQFANVYGVTAADLKAAANLAPSLEAITGRDESYDSLLEQVEDMSKTMILRTSIGEMMENMKSNFMYSMASTLANDPVSSSLNLVANMLNDLVGGIEIPFINVYGFGFDLNATIADLMNVAALAGPVLGGVGKMVAGLANLNPTNLLRTFGVEQGKLDVQTRGTAASGLAGSLSSGSSTSESGYVGNENGDDVKEKTVSDNATPLENQVAEAKEEQDNKEEARTQLIVSHIVEIYELLNEVTLGAKKLHVQLELGNNPMTWSTGTWN